MKENKDQKNPNAVLYFTSFTLMAKVSASFPSPANWNSASIAGKENLGKEVQLGAHKERVRLNKEPMEEPRVQGKEIHGRTVGQQEERSSEKINDALPGADQFAQISEKLQDLLEECENLQKNSPDLTAETSKKIAQLQVDIQDQIHAIDQLGKVHEHSMSTFRKALADTDDYLQKLNESIHSPSKSHPRPCAKKLGEHVDALKTIWKDHPEVLAQLDSLAPQLHKLDQAEKAKDPAKIQTQAKATAKEFSSTRDKIAGWIVGSFLPALHGALTKLSKPLSKEISPKKQQKIEQELAALKAKHKEQLEQQQSLNQEIESQTAQQIKLNQEIAQQKDSPVKQKTAQAAKAELTNALAVNKKQMATLLKEISGLEKQIHTLERRILKDFSLGPTITEEEKKKTAQLVADIEQQTAYIKPPEPLPTMGSQAQIEERMEAVAKERKAADEASLKEARQAIAQEHAAAQEVQDKATAERAAKAKPALVEVTEHPLQELQEEEAPAPQVKAHPIKAVSEAQPKLTDEELRAKYAGTSVDNRAELTSFGSNLVDKVKAEIPFTQAKKDRQEAELAAFRGLEETERNFRATMGSLEPLELAAKPQPERELTPREKQKRTAESIKASQEAEAKRIGNDELILAGAVERSKGEAAMQEANEKHLASLFSQREEELPKYGKTAVVLDIYNKPSIDPKIQAELLSLQRDEARAKEEADKAAQTAEAAAKFKENEARIAANMPPTPTAGTPGSSMAQQRAEIERRRAAAKAGTQASRAPENAAIRKNWMNVKSSDETQALLTFVEVNTAEKIRSTLDNQTIEKALTEGSNELVSQLLEKGAIRLGENFQLFRPRSGAIAEITPLGIITATLTHSDTQPRDATTPLHVLAQNSRLKVLEALQNQGQLTPELLRARDGKGQTPLMAALASGQLQTASFLLSAAGPSALNPSPKNIAGFTAAGLLVQGLVNQRSTDGVAIGALLKQMIASSANQAAFINEVTDAMDFARSASNLIQDPEKRNRQQANLLILGKALVEATQAQS